MVENENTPHINLCGQKTFLRNDNVVFYIYACIRGENGNGKLGNKNGIKGSTQCIIDLDGFKEHFQN